MGGLPKGRRSSKAPPDAPPADEEGPIAEGWAEQLAEQEVTPQIQRVFGVLDYHLKMAEKYTPSYLNAHALVVRAGNNKNVQTGKWVEHCAHGTAFTLEGATHYNMVREPQCGPLADAMKAHIDGRLAESA